MPSTRRTAELGTVAAILEDLRAIREDGGVARADDDAFTAIITELAPAQAMTDDIKLMAENLILAAQARFNCHLSVDGLRKREDGLLDRLAIAVHSDLQRAAEQRGPQTVEEVARYIIEDVRSAWEDIDDGLRRLYRAAPMVDGESKNSVVLSMLYNVAHMQYWFGRMIGIRMKVQQHSHVDLLFADVAAVVMAQAFAAYDDKRTVNELLTTVGRRDKMAFLDSLIDHPDGQDIFQRFRDLCSSCHLECAYQRTFNVGLLCPAHQLAFALYVFIDVHRELVSGELEDDLRGEFAQWSPNVRNSSIS